MKHQKTLAKQTGQTNPETNSISREATAERVKKLTFAAMLTAIVVILQLLGSFIHFGAFSITLVLVPIVIGAAMLGWVYSTWLGFVFGIAVLLSGDAGFFFTLNAWGTVITVLLKGALAGLITGLAYKGLSKYNKYAAIILAALICPLVNTGVFVLGCRVFFWDKMEIIANAIGLGLNSSRWAVVFGGLVGGNFFFELATNLILVPAIARILGVHTNQYSGKVIYGTILLIIGFAGVIYSLVTIGQVAGSAPLFSSYNVIKGEGLNPVQRFTILALVSDIVRVAGFVLLGIGLWCKRKARKESSEAAG